MAGISKHYIFSENGRQSLDYQIPGIMLDLFPQYAGALGGSPLAGQARLMRQLQAVVAETMSWRRRIRMMWALMPVRLREKVALQEYRVRPSRGSKQCPFRHAASILRKFHKTKKFALKAVVPQPHRRRDFVVGPPVPEANVQPHWGIPAAPVGNVVRFADVLRRGVRFG